jgi:nicotinate-nucleotide--dimethylbenzimidazole phosphoribosyltransferase
MPPRSEALTSLIAAIEPAHRADPGLVRERLDHLTKPPGSLGHLEELALRLALIYGNPPPSLRRRVVFVLAADHGVAQRGVSAYPAAVTAQMCRNFAAGGAAINAIGGAVGADVVAVDIGVDADLGDLPGVLHRKVRRGSRDLASEAALTSEETAQAILTGAALVAERADTLDVVALGDMGIGNSTVASALTAALTGRPVAAVVGPGTGVGGDRLAHKRAIVECAVRRIAAEEDPFEVLRQVGGLEIAGLAGVVLGAARATRAVVADGFIATAAALVAARLCPAARDYLFASHRSAEPGHRALLEALGLRPLLDLDLRLGEGTGAALCLPMLDAAGAILREMATFGSAGVSDQIEEPPNA